VLPELVASEQLTNQRNTKTGYRLFLLPFVALILQTNVLFKLSSGKIKHSIPTVLSHVKCTDFMQLHKSTNCLLSILCDFM